jgi:hypothetical protein
MVTVVITLAVVAGLGIAGIALLVAVISGIHVDERHMSLRQQPDTRVALIARRVLGVYSSPSKSLLK